MKKIILSIAAVMAFSTSLFIASCTETDPCAKVECGTHGTCNEGTCDCEAGYEKDTNGRCDLVTSTLWLGSYTGNDYDTKGVSVTGDYPTSIAAVAGDISKVSIENLGFYECKNTTTGTIIPYYVQGTISGNNITIDYTTCNNHFVGTGTLDRTAKKVTINYTATYGSPAKTDTNKAVLTLK